MYQSSVHSDRLVLCLALVLAAFAGAVFLFQAPPAFADTQQYDQASVDMPAPPRSFSRSITDGFSVTSAFANAPPGNFAPRVFHRTMSENVQVSTGIPGSAQNAEALGPQPRTSPYNLAQNQRPEDRLGFKNLSHKSDAQKNYGAVQQSATPIIVSTQGEDGFDVQELATVGDSGETDDNSLASAIRQVSMQLAVQKSAENQVIVSAASSGMLVVVALVALGSKSTQLAGTKTVILGMRMQLSRDGSQRLLVIVAAVFVTATALSQAFPVTAQEYAGGARIEISSAYHLDQNRLLVNDIYEQVSELDGVWSEEISDGHHVRVSFEQELTSARDISVYPRVVSGTPRIEVYEVEGNSLVAEFVYLGNDEYNKVYLKELQGAQRTFDLRVVGGSIEFDHVIDPAPIPTYVGAGTTFNNGNGGTVALPASLQANDILLLVIETANEAISVTAGGSAGTWTEVTNSPQGTGTAGGTSATALTVFWARYPGSGTTGPTISDSGNHQIAAIHAFRGVATTGDPWDVTSGNIDAASDTSLSADGATTTVENTLVVIAATLMDDNQNFGATWTNGDLANITVRNNFSGTAGNDGRGIVITGEKATAGTYGATTNTLTASSVKGMMTIALRPPPPVAPTLSISQPDGVNDTVSAGEKYNITYTLSDSDSVTTAAFYYDINDSGLDGTAISGACATAPEGTDVTCEWDTTGVSPGTYYVYGIADDGENPAVSAYSAGKITIDSVPAFIAAGATFDSISGGVVGLPSGLQADDVLLLFVETANQTVSVTAGGSAGTWTEVTNSPQGTGTAGGTSATALTVFWARYPGSGTTGPTISDSGNHQLAVILSFRGVATTGNPWNVTSGNTEATSDTSLSADGATTTVPRTLVVVASALMLSTNNFGATWTNADLTNITVRSVVSGATGNTGKLGIVTGKKVDEGTYGATINTLSSSSVKGMMTIALRPPAVEISRNPSVDLAVTDSISYKVSRLVPDSLNVFDSIQAVKVIGDTNEAALVYRSSTTSDSVPKYREWIPSTKSFSSEVELEDSGSPVRFALVEYSPVSTKRVIVVVGDDGTVDSYVCDTNCLTPGSWTVNHDVVDLWSSVSGDTRPLDIEFEYSTGDLIMVYDRFEGDSNASTDIAYRIMKDSETAFGDEQWIDDTNVGFPDVNYTFLRLDSKRKSGAEDIGLIAAGDSVYDEAVAFVWDGSSWGNQLVVTSNLAINTEEAVGIAYESNSADLIVVAGESGNIVYSEFDDTTKTWGTPAVMDTIHNGGTISDDISVGTINWIILRPNPLPLSDGIFLAVVGGGSDLDTAYWTGGTWSQHSEHDGGVDTNGSRNFDFTWDGDNPGRGLLVWGTTTGVVTYKIFAAPGSFGLPLTVDDDQTHLFVNSAQLPNPSTGDETAALIAVKDSGADISAIRWIGSTNAPTNTGDNAITTDGDNTTMNMSIAWKRSNVIKRWIADSHAVSDSVAFNVLRLKTLADTITITHPITAEKGAADTSLPAAAAYRSNTGSAGLSSPKYREWDPSTQAWSSEVELPDTGSDIREVRIAFSPVTSMRAIVSHSADGTYNLFVCDSSCTSAGSWSHVGVDFGDSGGPDPGRPYRPFDIAFETESGDLLIVYDKSGAVTADFYYRTYDGVTLSSEQSFDYIGSSADDEEIRYFRMASHPTSDEVTMVLEDIFNQDVYAFVWDGSSWGNQKTITTLIGSGSITSEAIGVAYEKTGAAVAFSANNSNSAAFARWNGSVWSSVSTTDPNSSSLFNDVRFVSMKGDPSLGSSTVMVCQSDNQSDLTCAPITAGVIGSWTVISTDIVSTTTRPFDFVWNPSGSKGVVTWNEASGAIKYRVWDGSAFGSEFSIASTGTQPWIVGATSGSIEAVTNAMFAKINSDFDGGAMKFKGDIVSVIGDGALTVDTVVTTFEGISVDVQRVRKIKRPLSDSITVSDNVTYKLTRGATDSVAIADAISTKVTRVLSDTIDVTDNASRSASRAVDDSVDVDDAISIIVTRSVSDSVAVSDAIAKSVTKQVSDSLAIADSVTGKVTARNISDTLDVDDAISTRITRVLSDTVDVADEVAGKVTARSVSETLPVTDAITFRITRSLSDTVDVADEVSAKITSRLVDDSVQVTDSIASRVTRSLSDSVEIADDASTNVSRAVADEVELTDSISTRVSRSISDTVDIDDEASAEITGAAISDELSLSDLVSININRQVADSLETAEEISRLLEAFRTADDSVAITDNVSATITRSADDSLEVTDEITKSVNKLVSDEVEISDAITSRIRRSITDELQVTDVVSKSPSRSIADELELADAISTRVTRSVSDTLAVTDAMSKSVTKLVADDLEVTDEVSAKIVARSVSDSIEVTDAITSRVTRSIADSLEVTDAIAKSVTKLVSDELEVTADTAKSVAREASDEVSIEDSIAMRVSRSLAETIDATDSVTPNPNRTVEDEVTIEDSIRMSVTRDISDSIDIDDEATAKVTARSVSDELEVTDSVTATISRQVEETVDFDDAISTRVTRSIADELEVTDDASTVASRSVDDTLDIDDVVTASVTRATEDEVEVTDEIATRVTRAAEDELEVTDEIATRVSRSIGDSLEVTDEASTTVPRAASDDLEVTDDITIAVSRDLEDSVDVEDAISTRVTRSIEEELEVTEEANSSTERSADDTLDIDDSISTKVSRSIDEELEVTDQARKSVTKLVSDELEVTEEVVGTTGVVIDDEVEVTDEIAKAVAKAVNDSMSVTDSISTRVSRSILDTLDADDSVAKNVKRFITETLALSDQVRLGPRPMDSVAVTDGISKSVMKAPGDGLVITDEVTAKITGVVINDELELSDEIARPGIPFSETISVTDGVAGKVNYVRELDEDLSVADSIFRPPTPVETVAVTDSISIGLLRLVDDSIGLSEEVRRGWLVSIADAVQVQAFLTDVSWTRTLALDEPFGLSTEICMPGLCDTNQLVSHNLGLQDTLELTIVPPPELEETLIVNDQITLGLKVSAVPPIVQSLSITDSVTAQIIGILVVETKESIGPLPSTPVSNTYTYTGNASDLKNAVIPVPIPINGTVVKPNLPNQITILRTYSVPVTWSDDIPTNNVIMSESQLEVPAMSNMFMRLNFNETPSLAPHKDFISTLDVQFTPKVSATDFGLVVAVTDKPAPAPTPADELKPIYLDVRWWGTFPGAEDPSVQSYYENPPTFTFTVNDQWVEDNNAARDAQGWPSLKLWLLNEGTNQWQQITSITKVSSSGDTYTFNATLPHFSNYAITANVVTSTPPGPGPIIIEPPVTPASFAVQLADSLGMQEGTQMTAVTIIEEFLQPKKVSVFLADLVTVATKPVAQPQEIKIDKDVTVKVSLEEVKQANLTDPGAVIDVFTNPSALAAIEVVITNDGEEDRQFEFIFTYNDARGDLHSQSAVLDVQGGSTVTRQVELPFTEPGIYTITVEVRNLPGGDLAGFSTLTIEIPWLGLYLYTVLGVAGAILGISGIAIAIYLLQRPEIPVAAGAAGAGLAVAAYKRKPKVRLFARDEEEFKKDHRYQVLARLELRKVVHAGSQLKAVFALDVWSKKDGREFVVTYKAINALGVTVHESHVLVPAVPDLQSLSIVMPFSSAGHYTIQAEARPELGGDVLDSATLQVTVNI